MLRAKRWSTTRIAEAIGVSDETVRRDLSISANAEIENPSRIDRLGGGTYPSSLPAPSQIAERRDVVARLREKRWSTTRIAEAIGVDEKTVRNDLSGSENSEPESPVTGQDGKSYPSTMPAPSQIVRQFAQVVIGHHAGPAERAHEARQDGPRWILGPAHHSEPLRRPG